MAAAMDPTEMRKQIAAIQADPNMSEKEKAQARQDLMSGKWKKDPAPQKDGNSNGDADKGKAQGVKAPAAQPSAMFDEALKCVMCMELAVRPITAPCQHNFCLGCFNKWTAQSKKTCPTCRAPFPAKWAANPRINTALAVAIRLAKQGETTAAVPKAFTRMEEKDRPDEAFTTDRAVRAGRANASSGRIMVNVPNDHFGPIPPEADPTRGLGVRVGEHWKDRLDCRQWGAHFPHVAGIAGQSGVGAQSVVISGGYEDDRDEGEWFLYTGSGGRDLSGNKRVTKVQSFDQTFDLMNKALQLSCQKGLPVRVVRSYKEKRSAYAPTDEQPVRYDGIYRIVRCWRKPGAQKHLICRYLFLRCDNEPAPWSSEDTGDVPWTGPLPKEAMDEMKEAKGKVTEMGDSPWWDFDPETKQWGWARPAPVSQRQGGDAASNPKKLRKKASEQQRALKEFSCKLCSAVLTKPVSTPCGHSFCKPCLDKAFEGVGDVEDRTAVHGRTMRVRMIAKPCPACKADIADFLKTAQVNRDMEKVIAQLQEAAAKAEQEAARLASGELEGGDDAGDDEADDDAASNEDDGGADAEEAALGGPAKEAAGPSGSGGEEAEGSGSAPEAATAPAAAAPSAGAASEPLAASGEKPAATGPGGVCGVSGSEVAALAAAYPEYDAEFVRGLLDDQGGDVEEVRAMLKRMRNQAAAAERKAAKANSPVKGKKRAAPAAEAAEGEGEELAAPEGQQPKEEDAAPAAAAPKAAPVKGRARGGKPKAKAGKPAAEDAEDVSGEALKEQEGAAAVAAEEDLEAAAEVAEPMAAAPAKVVKGRGRPKKEAKADVKVAEGADAADAEATEALAAAEPKGPKKAAAAKAVPAPAAEEETEQADAMETAEAPSAEHPAAAAPPAATKGARGRPKKAKAEEAAAPAAAEGAAPGEAAAMDIADAPAAVEEPAAAAAPTKVGRGRPKKAKVEEPPAAVEEAAPAAAEEQEAIKAAEAAAPAIPEPAATAPPAAKGGRGRPKKVKAAAVEEEAVAAVEEESAGETAAAAAAEPPPAKGRGRAKKAKLEPPSGDATAQEAEVNAEPAADAAEPMDIAAPEAGAGDAAADDTVEVPAAKAAARPTKKRNIPKQAQKKAAN